MFRLALAINLILTLAASPSLCRCGACHVSRQTTDASPNQVSEKSDSSDVNCCPCCQQQRSLIESRANLSNAPPPCRCSCLESRSTSQFLKDAENEDVVRSETGYISAFQSIALFEIHPAITSPAHSILPLLVEPSRYLALRTLRC